MSEQDAEQYVARVEEHFGRRRGGPLVLSPNDWRLLESWREQGIPLRLVLRGINRAFDRFEAAGPRADRINSLRYCEQEVQAVWQEHRGAQRGAAAGVPEEGSPRAAEHLASVAAACRSASRELSTAAAACLLDAAGELEALADDAQNLAPRELDASCEKLEQRVREALQQCVSEDAAVATLRLPPFSPFAAR